MKKLWFFILLTLFATNAFAERSVRVFGRVNAQNGDTFIVFPESSSVNVRVEFNLKGITFPQKGDPGYRFSQEWLSETMVGKDIELRYNRKTHKGVVSIHDKSINVEAVRAGAAIPDMTYRKHLMTKLLDEAKNNQVGMWEGIVLDSTSPKLAHRDTK